MPSYLQFFKLFMKNLNKKLNFLQLGQIILITCLLNTEINSQKNEFKLLN